MLNIYRYAKFYDILSGVESGRKLIRILNGLIPGLIREPARVPVRNDRGSGNRFTANHR